MGGNEGPRYSMLHDKLVNKNDTSLTDFKGIRQGAGLSLSRFSEEIYYWSF